MKKGKRFLKCPDCHKYGVYWRAAARGEDAYRCRYCWWYAYTQGNSAIDARELGILESLNLGKMSA